MARSWGPIGALALIAAIAAGSPAARAADPAPSPFPTALVDNPCPPPLTAPARDAPAVEREAYAKAQADRAAKDWPNLCRYKAANAAITGPVRVVFMGDSITQAWAAADRDLFSDGVVGRGISSQSTPQMVLRFYSDVIALKPQVVHIMTGTNDAAGNTGPSTVRDYTYNIMTMVELAQAHGIKVVLASIPPAAAFWWSPTHRPAETIVGLNAWLKNYAAEKGLVYVDYHAVLSEPDGSFKKALANDGVHPNAAGYALMRPLAEQAIAAALAR
jgi:lysophospholipase L1-like esterase